MPPRHAYWTIIVDDQPTAFRAHDAEELLPTLNRLREKNASAVMKWFERGQLFDSRDAARDAGFGQGERRWEGPRPERGPEDERRPRQSRDRHARGDGERPRDKNWRPGGTHSDPRQKYRDAKKAKWDRFKKKIRDSQERRATDRSETPGAGDVRPESFSPPHGDPLRDEIRESRGARPPRPDRASRPDRAPRPDRPPRQDWTDRSSQPSRPHGDKLRSRPPRQEWRRDDREFRDRVTPDRERRDRERPDGERRDRDRPQWQSRDRGYGDRNPGPRPAPRKPWSGTSAEGPRKPWGAKPSDGRRPPPGGRKPWGTKPAAGGKKPWGAKPAVGGRKPWGSKPGDGDRKPWGSKPGGRKPWTAKPPGRLAQKPWDAKRKRRKDEDE